MRLSARLAPAGALLALLLSASSAFAQDPPPATPEPAPAPAPAPPPGSDRPNAAAAEEDETLRDEGVRLGIDVGFTRAFGGDRDRLNEGSPSLIPIGIDISFRSSPTILWGLHAYAALASRDDCIEVDSCRARAYGVGGHVETTLGSGVRRSFVPWLRYGLTYEILYQGGLPLDPAGHIFRGAFDFIDFRLGGDFVVSRGAAGKVSSIGPYAGFAAGVLVNQSGVTTLGGSSGQPRDFDRSSGSAHAWIGIGVRGTIDP